MRNFILSLIFLFAAGYAAKIAYNNFMHGENGFLKKDYSYPDEITVENKSGAEIQITLIGRSSTYLEFENKEGRKFVYPINSLSEKSQAVIMKYPDSGINDPSSYLSSGGIKLNDTYILQLEEEVHKLQTKMNRLINEAEAATSNSKRRTLEKKIEALRVEIVEIQSQIADRQQ